MHSYVLRWRGGDESLWSHQEISGVDFYQSGPGEKSQGSLVAPEANEASPYQVSRYVGVAGVWIRVRKPEGERDVGRHRIL